MKTAPVVCLLSSICLVFSGCSSSSEEPLSPSPNGQGAFSIAAPGIASPIVDEQWGWLEQPVVLTVNNATVTGTSTAPVTYEFEVATDAGFTNFVHRESAVAQGAGTTRIEIPVQALPGFLHWRARATNGTVTSAYSNGVKFEIEGQGGHVLPDDFVDPSGNPLSEEYAEEIINGCGDEFPHTLAVYGSEAEAEAAAEELLLRIIWHLKLAGFDAAQQRNPSGAISKDKLNIFIRQTWRTYDIFALGLAGVPNRISGLGRVFPENPIPTDGIAD